MFLHNTVELLEMAFLFIKDLYKRWGFLYKVRTKLLIKII